MHLWRPIIASPWCAASRIASSQLHTIRPQKPTCQAPLRWAAAITMIARTWARIPFLANCCQQQRPRRSFMPCTRKDSESYLPSRPPRIKTILFLTSSPLFHLSAHTTARAGLYLEKHLLLTWISRRLGAECQCPPDLGLHLSKRHLDQISATAPPTKLLTCTRTTLESTP